jgi:hypothetical protein
MYCGENSNYGMMGSGARSTMMRGMMGYGNAGPGFGMMGQNYAVYPSSGNRGYGMMGNYGNQWFNGWNFFEVLLLILIIGLIIAVYLHIWKKVQNTEKKRNNK